MTLRNSSALCKTQECPWVTPRSLRFAMSNVSISAPDRVSPCWVFPTHGGAFDAPPFFWAFPFVLWHKKGVLNELGFVLSTICASVVTILEGRRIAPDESPGRKVRTPL